jgi:hypothetical protein
MIFVNTTISNHTVGRDSSGSEASRDLASSTANQLGT